MKLEIRIASLALLLLAVVSSASAQIQGFNGKWALNREKSQDSPTDRMAKTQILTITVTDDEEHYVTDEVREDGRKSKSEYRAKFDGKEYPNRNLVTGAVAYVRLKKVFDRTEQLVNVRDGTVTSYYIRVLSLDGQSFTSMLINADGQVTGVRVFEKQ